MTSFTCVRNDAGSRAKPLRMRQYTEFGRFQISLKTCGEAEAE
jgi:hypothetical protein